MAKKMTRGSGNVFKDLGFAADEAENLRVRADLMASIRGIIEKDELTQASAAELFGVSQPRVSDLVRGKIELFSIDALVNMLGAAGHRVKVSVARRNPRAA
jgi:predicted XRE-type DNA-binding protein